MSREKQIEEMAKVIEETNCGYGVDGCHCCEFDVTKDVSCADRRIAIALYKAGYRKASEVAREIFEEIERQLNDFNGSWADTVINTQYLIAELKKKYIGEDTNVTTNTEEGK